MVLDILAISHLMVTASYVVIPTQFCLTLSQSQHRHNIPPRLVFCLILVALFFFLCGFAHFLLAMGQGGTTMFFVTQCGNAIVSTTTAFYLIPLIPDMFALLDSAVANLRNETKESKSKLFTFMAFLCHEIRNPLFAITSSAECLQDTPLSQEQTEEVSSICDSSLLMLRLVNDVLDLSKLESGKLQLECREFDLHSLLKRLGDNMARQVQRKHQGAVQLVCTWGEDVPRFVLGDSVRILQIIYNLLSNSCKFTSQGTIELRVEAREPTDKEWEEDVDPEAKPYTVTMGHNRPVAMFASDNNNNNKDAPPAAKEEQDDENEESVFSMALLGGGSRNSISSSQAQDLEAGHPEEPQGAPPNTVVLSISVSDSGIGIPPDRLAMIFEPYTQAKLSDFRQHGGTGLGLSIISSLSKTMGGTIGVTSMPGQGAKFHLKLPVKLPEEGIAASTGESISSRTRQSISTNNSGMDYIGELLPSDKKKVPKNFLEAQRMPTFHRSTTQEQAALERTPTIDNKGASALFPIKSSEQQQPLFSLSSSPLMSGSPPTMYVEMSSSGKHDNNNSMDMSTSARTTNDTFNHLQPNNHVVLVVDDNSVNRKILGKMLRGFAIGHRMACNGQEAVDALLQSRNHATHRHNDQLPLYGLVFMDISMPVMDGNTAIQTIRAANITVPIVALSANVLSEERDRTIGLGADDFQSKPILRNNLHSLCERYLLPSSSTSTVPTTRTRRRDRIAHQQAASAIGTRIAPLPRSTPRAIPTGKSSSEITETLA